MIIVNRTFAKYQRQAFATIKEVRDMVLDRIALILVVIGALNWGVIGLFGLDLVAFVFGGQMAVIVSSMPPCFLAITMPS